MAEENDWINIVSDEFRTWFNETYKDKLNYKEVQLKNEPFVGFEFTDASTAPWSVQSTSAITGYDTERKLEFDSAFPNDDDSYNLATVMVRKKWEPHPLGDFKSFEPIEPNLMEGQAKPKLKAFIAQLIYDNRETMLEYGRDALELFKERLSPNIDEYIRTNTTD
jgi:hypothetical protein